MPAAAPTLHTFHHSLKIGVWAEERARSYLLSVGYEVDVLARDHFFQSIGCDFVARRAGEQSLLVEVKGDKFRNMGKGMNIYLEVMGNNELGIPGCFISTASDVIFYYLVSEGFALLIPTKSLQDWIAGGGLAPYKKKTIANKSGDEIYTSDGYPVPVDDISRMIPGVERIDGLERMEGRSDGAFDVAGLGYVHSELRFQPGPSTHRAQ